MSVIRSQQLETAHEDHSSDQVREAHRARPQVDIALPGNATVSTAHGIRISFNPYHHTAFMQCRTCCNCSPQCSYYGKGHFDAQGNYVGS